MSFSHEQAEQSAIEVLTWMTSDPEMIGQFLGWSGADVDALKQIAGSPQLISAILDFVMLRDDWVIAASAHLNIKPEKFVELRRALPGGQDPHWT